MQILLVEDELHLAEGIAENLRAEGYGVTVAADGQTGLAQAQSGSFDLLILDVMLPKLDGYGLCRQLRAAGSDVPILFLTAKGDLEDKIHGLQLGADDYLPKPFDLRELLLRVAAMLRRQRSAGPLEQLQIGKLSLDPATGLLRYPEGHTALLPARALRILLALQQASPEVVTRENLLQAGWGEEVYPSSRILEELVGSLRSQLQSEAQVHAHIETVPGIGYRLRF